MSGVKKMRNMFEGACAFNADISNWDVTGDPNISSIKDDRLKLNSYMFWGCNIDDTNKVRINPTVVAGEDVDVDAVDIDMNTNIGKCYCNIM